MSDIKFKNKVKAEAGVNFPAESASKALTINSSGDATSSTTTDTELGYLSGTTSAVQTQLNAKEPTITTLPISKGGTNSSTALGGNKAIMSNGTAIVESSVTSTELGYVSGVTSALQTQLNNKIETSERGANNGVATLDAGGKVPAAQLPNTVMEFKGTYDPNTDTPSLTDGTGNAGDVYVANAGSNDFGSGSITFAAGDWVVYNGTIYEKSINSNAVVSVNGQQGVVSLDTDDVSEGATNLYFTDGRAQAAITGGASSIVTSDLTASRALASDGTGKVAVSTVTTTELEYVSGVTSAIQTQLNGKEPTITTLPISKGGTNSGTALNNSRIMVSDGGAIVETAALTDGQVLIGSTGANPVVANITAGTGISITNGAGSVTIAAVGASAGDIPETYFGASNNQAAAADVTGLAFAAGVVRSFDALVSVAIDATASLYEVFKLNGVQLSTGYTMYVSSTGDTSGVVFTITTAGQVQYTSTNVTGFVSDKIQFRAITTAV